MPETVLTASSSGLVTVVSISSALAPGTAAVMERTGKSILGNKSTPSSTYATSPRTRGTATSTQVKIGRRMQTSETIMASFLDARGGRLDLRSTRGMGGGGASNCHRLLIREAGLTTGDHRRTARERRPGNLDPFPGLYAGDDENFFGLAVLGQE